VNPHFPENLHFRFFRQSWS